jgi:hypothetical protein
LSFRLKLESGVEILLSALSQRATYMGLLEGSPTREMNFSIIRETANVVFHGFSPLVIAPTQKAIPRSGEPYPFGEPATLPAVSCLALFESCQKKPGFEQDDATELVLAWWQDEFALPIAPDVLAKIRTLDWGAVCYSIIF